MIYLCIATLILAVLLIREIGKRKELSFQLLIAENEAKKVEGLQNELKEKDNVLRYKNRFCTKIAIELP